MDESNHIQFCLQVPFDSKAYLSYGYYVPKPGEYPEYGRPKPLGKKERV